MRRAVIGRLWPTVRMPAFAAIWAKQPAYVATKSTGLRDTGQPGLSDPVAAGEVLRCQKRQIAGLSYPHNDLPALAIAELYRCRWQVELFFKWIRQHLRIKAFFGTSENAVKTQAWIAIAVYVFVAILKKRLKSEDSLYTILQILSLTLFDKILLNQLVKNTEFNAEELQMPNQLN
jgi:transposase